jgi:hypothetical protein
MQFLPCLLCTAKLEKRIDKNGKPYFVCNPCGIQFFIRRQHGIDLLEKLIRDCQKNEIPFKQQNSELEPHRLLCPTGCKGTWHRNRRMARFSAYAYNEHAP